MGLLKWDELSERLYETGVSKCVLYPYDSSTKAYGTGIAWNGITGITESPEGAEPTDLYADNIKYLTLRSAETLGATIEAYMYPDEFMECDGTAPLSTDANCAGIYVGQQSRKSFGLCYETILGSADELDAHGKKIHILYGCTASPSEKAYSTTNDSPEAITFSWELKTVPIEAGSGLKPTASIVIDTTKLAAGKLAILEKTLYGQDADAEHSIVESDPTLPTPAEIIALLTA